ncbi:unnamed protein product [Peronospora belbahrii]|uniref:Uncharacterized protein n=1 Tax=Peronospora belbahrii TaxID=622444 RepID=A0AAU9LDL3_9STRA|nr:unnamed protein product [Peronospora belbahrii]CAH0516910.1 unnamed protein product [Peronospora belbahrii]
MHQPSTASFFPTAKELSSGIQWFKDHPVLAAVAATAVSMITYLNALELAEADVQGVDDEVTSPPRPSSSSSTTASPPPPPAATVMTKKQRKATPNRRKGLSGAPSDGKLSAAVSWCDEHGGSLTQVFENDPPTSPGQGKRLDDSDDEACDDVAKSFLDAFQQHRVTLASGLHKSVTTQQLDAVAAIAAAVNDSEVEVVQADSPQWGWYVPITPPQDQLHLPTGRDSQVVTSSSMTQTTDTDVEKS